MHAKATGIEHRFTRRKRKIYKILTLVKFLRVVSIGYGGR
jgi:hypothetical protein